MYVVCKMYCILELYPQQCFIYCSYNTVVGSAAAGSGKVAKHELSYWQVAQAVDRF
jgi:hypothetical protein